MFEIRYAEMIETIRTQGEERHTRNGMTKSLFGMSLLVEVGHRHFPILQGRKMYPRGVLGELAAMLRKPKHINDFKFWGCNYWDKWADADGSIRIDYGNAWFKGGQIDHLKDCLANNPTDRRMIINAWVPENLPTLSLPCCHYSYQFYVRAGNVLDMIWTQRSVDMMIGLPSDIVFGAAWLIAIANEFNMVPGNIKFDLGDCHIYEEHLTQAKDYVQRVCHMDMKLVDYSYNGMPGLDFCEFTPDDLELYYNNYLEPMQLELKA